MKNIKRLLIGQAAVILVLTTMLSTSVGTIWAKYTMDIPVTKSLSLSLNAKYNYYELPTAAANTTTTDDDRYPTCEDVAVDEYKLTKYTIKANTSDPRVKFDTSSIDTTKTVLDTYPYLAITYMTQDDEGKVGNVFFSGNKTSYSSYADKSKASLKDSGGKYVTTIIDLKTMMKNIDTENTYIKEIRLDFFNSASKGDIFYLESIIFCESEDCANDLATEKSAALNCTINYQAADGGTVSPASETIGINLTPSGSTATANENYEFYAWTTSNDELLSPFKKLIPENQSATYIATFKQKTEDSSREGFDIDFEDKQTTRVSAVNVNENLVAVLEIEKENSDPWIEFTLGKSSGLTLGAYPYIAITYMTTADDSASLYYMGDGEGDYAETGTAGVVYYSEDLKIKFSDLSSGSVSNGKYVTAIINARECMSKSTYIEKIRLDYFASGNVGDEFYLDSIIFCENESTAKDVAAARSAELNCTISYKAGDGGSVDISEEIIAINAKKALTKATATPTGDNYTFDGWYDESDKKVGDSASFLPPQTVGEYYKATYTAKFTSNITNGLQLQSDESSPILTSMPDSEPAIAAAPVNEPDAVDLLDPESIAAENPLETPESIPDSEPIATDDPSHTLDSDPAIAAPLGSEEQEEAEAEPDDPDPDPDNTDTNDDTQADIKEAQPAG